MTIGLDLSVLQTPHRMRGIGATAINFVNHLPDKAKKQHTFVLFLYENNRAQALDLLDLKGLNYEIRDLQKPKKISLKLPGKLRKLNGMLTRLKQTFDTGRGDPRGGDVSLVDTYLQFDQMQAPPKRSGLKTSVILYDLIPYVMEADYLWSYQTARQNGYSRRGSLRQAFLRMQYLAQAKAVCRATNNLIAISAHTKKDFVKYAGVNASKIKVVHLGIDQPKTGSRPAPKFEQYIENSWGYFPHAISLSDKPFLLFVGGADPRRRLIDLVAAYNNLRAQGHDIRLVLAGDTMKGPRAIPVLNIQKYLLESSYLDDIIFLGFVTDQQREWLYQNALAFVYPSVYEGFGLPVLEAMKYGTPVITYDNTSIREVAGEAAIYAKDFQGTEKSIVSLVDKKSHLAEISEQGKSQAEKFSWTKTSTELLKLLS